MWCHPGRPCLLPVPVGRDGKLRLSPGPSAAQGEAGAPTVLPALAIVSPAPRTAMLGRVPVSLAPGRAGKKGLGGA